MNVGAVLLLVLGLGAAYVGIKGSQATVFSALTGSGATPPPATPPAKTTLAPAPGAAAPVTIV